MRTRSGRMLAAIAAAAVALATAGAAEAGSSGGTPVLTGSKRDVYPAATPGGTTLGYSENAPGAPNHFDAYVKQGSAASKINVRGQGFAGGFDAGNFVYQSLYQGRSNIRLYDVGGARHLANFGAKVNTDRWEWRPTISGDHLLFSRFNQDATRITDRVLLYDTANDTIITLDKQQPGKPRFLIAGQVNGNSAVWETQVAATRIVNVRLYRITQQDTQILPLPRGKLQYAPSVSDAGDVVYVRSSRGCGRAVVIRMRTAGGADSVLTAVPSGFDVFKTYTVDEAGGGLTVYYDVFRCATGGIDIYKVSVP